jgi:hypothetical protein
MTLIRLIFTDNPEKSALIRLIRVTPRAIFSDVR